MRSPKRLICKGVNKMILMIDNYDSFTYNLYQQIGSLYPDIKVIRNDEITIEEIAANKESILVSVTTTAFN